MSNYVLDSSAVLAVALQEPGREHARPRLAGSLISTVNLQEVIEIYSERGRPVDGLIRMLLQLNVEFIDYTLRHAELAAALKPVCKPQGISFADRACLALAKSEGLPVLTGDRQWATVDHGVTVELIR